MNAVLDIDLSVIQGYLIEYGLAVLYALVIFFIGKWLAKLTTRLVRKAMARARVDDTLIGFTGNVLYTLLLAFVIIASLSELGIETTSLAAIFAAAGLAIGLALQGSLGNLASGVMIIALRPFKSGDFIEAAGTSGVVEEVGIFATKMKTGDNKSIIVPNGAITSDIITNYSTKDTRRIDLVFGCGYEDDLRKVKQVLKDILAKEPRILEEPEPLVAVQELADSSVNFVVRPWVKSGDYWSVYFDLTEAVKLRFDEEGIAIPFPQRDVHIKEVVGMAELKKSAA